MTTRSPVPKWPRAFTLVELLVVVGIIALLVSILMPALRQARMLAQRTQCLSQVKQLGAALMSYAAETKGRTPVQPYDAVPNWADPAVYDSPPQPSGAHLLGRSAFAALLPYLSGEKRVFVCPVAYDFSWRHVASDGPTALSDTGYMANAAVVDRRLAQVRNSARVVFVQENRHRWNNAWLRPARVGGTPRNGVYSMWSWDNPTPRNDGKPWGQEYSSIHEGGGNLLFVDGHAEYRKHKDLRARDFGLGGGAGVGGRDDDPSHTPHGTTYLCVFD
jgi:prepilin-type N-terminal cleavage/methylation domain-containing protein/prepilin-type processing-associated H-X9-DG protein